MLDWWCIRASTVAVAAYCTVRLFKVMLQKTIFAPFYSITEYKDNVVYVFEFPRKWTRQMLNLSPFAVKLEAWLRCKNVEYQIVETNKFSKSTRQIPYVLYNGIEYTDTVLMIDQLTAVLDLPKDDLTPEQEGISRAFIRMVDEGLAINHFLFRYYHLADDFFHHLFRPREKRWLVRLFKFLFQRAIKIKAGGLGRHTKSEFGEIGKDDVRAISRFLGKKKFTFGETINTVDCAIFGQLSQIFYIDLDFPYKAIVDTECPNIMPYLDRIKDALWPDWDEMVNKEPFYD